MPERTYDVAVVGLGAMGSAVLAHCALRGAGAIGFEQFERGHDRGSSSGKTRIIRQAYFEHEAYVPLLLRAYELWHELGRKTNTSLIRFCGLLLAGEPGSEIVSGTLRAAQIHGLPLEQLDAAEIVRRYPQLCVRAGEVGLFERKAGAIFPEAANEAHLQLALAHGAQAHFNTELIAWDSGDDAVELRLSDGRRIRAHALVLTLGAWFARELKSAGAALEVQRNVQCWFTPQTGLYLAQAFPAFLLQRAELPAPLYGFPDFGDGVKAAFHGLGAITSPSNLLRELQHESDVAPVARALEGWMPGAAGTFRAGKVCMYANTPDRNFVIDRHPDHANVVLCGGFSGHGFKFASVAGEICADLALYAQTRHDIAFLSLDRLAKK